MKTQCNQAASLPAFKFIFLLLISGCTEGTWYDRTPIDGGRLSALVASPEDSNILIAGTPGGGIWRTRDGGANWIKPEGYALADFTILDLQWDKVVSGRLLACTPSDVYASTDMGDRWENLTRSGGYPPAILNEPYLRPLADPYAFAQLPVGSGQRFILYSKAGQGLLYSQDGINFSQHYPFPGGARNPDNYITCIGVDEASGVVYIGTYGTNVDTFDRPHLFKSACAWTATGPCLTWVSANEGLPYFNGALVSAVVSGGSAGRMALAISDQALRPIFFVTEDGSRWRATATQPHLMYTSIAPVRQLVSYRPNQLIAGGIVAKISEDWGATWSDLTIPQLHPDVRAFTHAIYPSGGYVWAVTDGISSSQRYHNIARWNLNGEYPLSGGRAIPVNGLKALQPFYVVAPGTAGRRLFTGTLDNSALVSDDGGIRWTTRGVPRGFGCGDYICMAVAPSDPNRVYSVSCGSDTLDYTDNAVSAASSDMIRWNYLAVPFRAALPSDWNNHLIAVHPTNPNRICIAYFNFIAFANDIRTPVWERRTLPGNLLLTCVYYDAAGNLYAGTRGNGVYRSANNGETWAPFGLNTGSPHHITKITHSTSGGGEGTFFIGTTRGLYRKLPGGTYTLQTADPSYSISDIEVDPSCPSRIYISMGMVGIRLRHRGGVLVSEDNGTTFESITSSMGIHQSPVADIQVDPTNSRYLYVASHGLGVWTFERPSSPPCR